VIVIRWFGLDWGAPVCAPSRRIAVPVGWRCAKCTREIEANDRGLMMGDACGDDHPWHLACFLAELGIVKSPSSSG